ncbi:MAG: hypothetical protein R2795_22825 [Saprospiraceae bacterium]
MNAGGTRRVYTVPASAETVTYAQESCEATPDCGTPTPTEPTVAAPTPHCNQADVISLFSDAYTDVAVDTWLTGWSGASGGGIVPIAGNDTRLYTNVDFLGEP